VSSIDRRVASSVLLQNQMNDLSVVERAPEWQRLKALVLDSVSSPITRRVYNMALDEFVAWFWQEPRPGFSKATVNAWRVSLEARASVRRRLAFACRPFASSRQKPPTTAYWRRS